MPDQVTVTIARGDGIGPEIMESVLTILKHAKAPLKYEEIDIGEKIFNQGFTSGMRPEAWESLRRTKILLKSPITTPQGSGVKSLNVTLRTVLGLFANVRPCRAFHPFVKTKSPTMDVVIIRENQEDLYTGIEHQQTDDVVQCLKLISRPGSERIIRYAFEFAKAYKRRKVTCFSKDNIMKLTDGLFHKLFNEIAREYPNVESDHLIIDIGAARVADSPEIFDVIVMPNLYGDIVSDIAAQVAGSVGLAGSSNIGPSFAMFEAIHGSAPTIAGQGLANPSGLISGAVMMLVHLGMPDVGERIGNALLKTIEEGIHTADIYNQNTSQKKVSTSEFTDAVVKNLGSTPSTLQPVSYAPVHVPIPRADTKRTPPEKKLMGIDVFIDFHDRSVSSLAERLQALNTEVLELNMISNRGTKVWPNAFSESPVTNHWLCRFQGKDGAALSSKHLVTLLAHITESGLEFIKVENLYAFDGVPAYSLAQGE